MKQARKVDHKEDLLAKCFSLQWTMYAVTYERPPGTAAIHALRHQLAGGDTWTLAHASPNRSERPLLPTRPRRAAQNPPSRRKPAPPGCGGGMLAAHATRLRATGDPGSQGGWAAKTPPFGCPPRSLFRCCRPTLPPRRCGGCCRPEGGRSCSAALGGRGREPTRGPRYSRGRPTLQGRWAAG